MLKRAVSILIIASFIVSLLWSLPVFAYTASGRCGDSAFWELDIDGTLTIRGEGTVKDFETYGHEVFDESAVQRIITESGITKIMWENCFRNLRSVYISDTVCEISVMAFEECPLIEEFAADENNPWFCISDGNLFSRDMTELMFYARGKKDEIYTIPYGVTHIGSFAFACSTNLVEIVFPDTLTYIGNFAFSDCTNLQKAELPESVSTIGMAAFAVCSSLNIITIPDGVSRIGVGAFSDCENLLYIIIPESVTTISVGAFSYIPQEAVIYGVKNSRAYWFAEESGIKFSRMIKVKVYGKEVEFDQIPVAKEGRTLVPVRAIFEALGATVGWDGATSTVTSTLGDVTISLVLGSPVMTVNGKEIMLDIPAEALNGRTLVPVRAISEAFGNTVTWNEEEFTVMID